MRRSGDPLPGVNVLIDGTQQGTVTDLDGNYIIVNVRPGDLSILFSFIGFATQRMDGVRVSTGQTTRLDVELNEEVIEVGASGGSFLAKLLHSFIEAIPSEELERV